MAAVIWGVVKDGKIVPHTPLPEGLHVQITVPETSSSPRSFGPTWMPGLAETPKPSPWSKNWPKRWPAMKKGEIWRLRFPFPGRTQAGERPAVIVHNEPSLSSLPVVLVVPFTSQHAAARFPGTLAVQPDSVNGLSLPSVALVFQLGAQDKRNFRQRLGELDPATLDAILDLIRQLTL